MLKGLVTTPTQKRTQAGMPLMFVLSVAVVPQRPTRVPSVGNAVGGKTTKSMPPRRIAIREDGYPNRPPEAVASGE